MAGSKTAYLAQKQLDHTLGGAPYTPPPTLFLCLSLNPFNANSTGSAMAEVAAADYHRLELDSDSGTWSPATLATPSEKHNLVDLLFDEATSGWGTPMSAYLADAPSGGNLLYGSDITNAQPVNVGDAPKIPAGAFVFNEV